MLTLSIVHPKMYMMGLMRESSLHLAPGMVHSNATIPLLPPTSRNIDTDPSHPKHPTLLGRPRETP